MTRLEDELKSRIMRDGPIPVSDYMAEVLMHPEFGYYNRANTIGASGDFTTAPEISQIFGELLGLWLADRWDVMGRPSPVNLVELGPGRGTLMVDVLRAMKVMADMPDAIDLHLVEASTRLHDQQARRLEATWHRDLSSVPPAPTLLIANEFFDALPVRQFEKTRTGWSERLVAVHDDHFAIVTSQPSAHVALIPDTVIDAPTGAIAEVCPTAVSIAGAIAERISSDGGAALIVDYGHSESAPGDTLQAVRRHQYVDIFSRPGESDLTAHVDFEQLAHAARQAGARVLGPRRQGAFLESLGIHVRAEILKRRLPASRRDDISAAVRRLTAPDMMGDMFKVLAIVPEDMADMPAGFWDESND